jgi:hypothetical protein
VSVNIRIIRCGRRAKNVEKNDEHSKERKRIGGIPGKVSCWGRAEIPRDGF